MKAFEAANDGEDLEGCGLRSSTGWSPPQTNPLPSQAVFTGTHPGQSRLRSSTTTGTSVASGLPRRDRLRGPNVMKGYWNLPDETAAALRATASSRPATSANRRRRLPVHRRPQEGPDHRRRRQRLSPRDRGGVYEHPAFREAAVVGVRTTISARRSAPRSRSRTTRVHRGRASANTFKEQVAAYKYPRTVWFVDELPKGPTGKILKREIEPPG